MPIRLHYKIQVGVSSTSNEDNDLGNMKLDVVCDGLESGGASKYLLKSNQQDVAIPVPPGTCLLVLRTTAKDPTLRPVAVDLKLNVADAAPLPILPLPGADEGFLFLPTSDLATIYITNDSPGTPTDMEITVITAGTAAVTGG